MIKIILFVVTFLSADLTFGQTTENEKLIELGKAYKDFMFRNRPPRGFTKSLQTDVPENLKLPANFIAQAISTDNDLLKEKYLSLPDIKTLKAIYTISLINNNIRSENPIDNNKLIDSITNVDISKNELVDTYYSMLFSSVANKMQPFDLSKVNFRPKDYSFTNDSEVGIFFLQCMRLCGLEIWGYMNVVKPPNTKKALEYISKFPQFNGLKYYQFTDLNFPDFEMAIQENKGKESYKGYYIDKYYDLLLSNLICLNQEGATEKEVNDLLLGSILKDHIFYKYTKNREKLEDIFRKVKQ